MPVYVAQLAILSWQNLIYAKRRSVKNQLGSLHLYLALIALSTALMAQYYPFLVGWYAGWIAVGGKIFCDFPQVLTNYARKSTRGFSFVFASLTGFAAFSELMIGIALNFPAQSLVLSSVLFSFYVVYVVQFKWYAKPRKKKARVDQQAVPANT